MWQKSENHAKMKVRAKKEENRKESGRKYGYNQTGARNEAEFKGVRN